MTGTLYLVPAPLDFGCESASALDMVLPAHTLRTAASLRHWICENAKTTRAYLKRIEAMYPLGDALQTMQITELPREVHKKGDHQGGFDARPLLKAALEGHDLGLVSEAGMPAIADPGSSVVRAAHRLGIRVVPLVGPVSLMLTLAASGLNGQNFAFVGYLPAQEPQRTQRIAELEGLARKSGQTQLFIETPYRNAALLQSLLKTLRPGSMLAAAAGLTLETGTVRSGSVQDWREKAWTVEQNVPTVFAIGC